MMEQTMSHDTTETIPTTREEAIARLVEQDVQKWGESERAASERHHAANTLGLALNTLASRAAMADQPDAAALRAAADAALTSDDWDILRNGG